MTAANGFLPQFSGSWRYLPDQEVFFDVSKNMRSYYVQGLTFASPFGVSTWDAFRYDQKHLKPEKDWVYEVGWRLMKPRYTALVTLYHVDFSDRQQKITTGVGGVREVSTVANVGAVTTNGVEGSLTVRPVKGLSIYNSISWNRSTFNNNFSSGDVFFDVKGKKVPNYPSLMYKASLTYEYKSAYARIDTLYTSSRPLSYTNDVHVPSSFITNLSAGYTFKINHGIQTINVSFNVYNLTNQEWIANTGDIGSPRSGDYQTFMPGAPRSYYGTVRADF